MAAKKSIRSMLVIKAGEQQCKAKSANLLWHRIILSLGNYVRFFIVAGFQRAPLPYVPALELPSLAAAGSHPKNDGMLEL